MVFIIQNTQNRDGAAIQAKLDELIRVSSAQNTLIGIEHLTVDEISEIHGKCVARAKKQGMERKTTRSKKRERQLTRQFRKESRVRRIAIRSFVW
jgi:low affinity Fe/Cu permease